MFVYVLEYDWRDSAGEWSHTTDVYEHQKDAYWAAEAMSGVDLYRNVVVKPHMLYKKGMHPEAWKGENNG